MIKVVETFLMLSGAIVWLAVLLMLAIGVEVDCDWIDE